MRVGIGYDIHRLEEKNDLVLGGVNISYKKGLVGHSDADVLVHSLIDALLGAVGLGDIGTYFPDTDPRYENISSMKLLEKTVDLLQEENYYVNNVDLLIIAESPKLSPYREQMVANIAGVLNVEVSRVNLKATTAEGLGFVGKEEGIAAKAIVSVK